MTTAEVKLWIETKMQGSYDYHPQPGSVEVMPDPKVPGTFAARFTDTERDGENVDLLFITGQGPSDVDDDAVLDATLEEVEFESWPPASGDLKFFT